MITLDWDNTSKRECLRRIKDWIILYYSSRTRNGHLRKNKPIIYYRRSCNKKGYHVKILGVDNNFGLRILWDDDWKRIQIEHERLTQGFPINVLFSEKKYPDGTIKKAGEWRRIK